MYDQGYFGCTQDLHLLVTNALAWNDEGSGSLVFQVSEIDF